MNDLFKNVEDIIAKLFKHDQIEFRWVETTFPFTQPSWEMEIRFNTSKLNSQSAAATTTTTCTSDNHTDSNNEWIEVLGCGILKNEIIANSLSKNSDVDKKDIKKHCGWAFGIGLERLAMLKFKIDDIRSFWSKDERFISQFAENGIETVFKPYSSFLPITRDVSFWYNSTNQSDFDLNTFNQNIRDLAGDFVEEVKIVDTYLHPKKLTKSYCIRLVYRRLDRILSDNEVNQIHSKVVANLVDNFDITLR